MQLKTFKSVPKAALFGAALLGWAIMLELGCYAFLRIVPQRLNPSRYYLQSMIDNFHPLFQTEGGHAAHKYYPYVGFFREGDWTKGGAPPAAAPPDGWVIPLGKGQDGVERYVPMAKPEGTLRVIALGGSTMAGMGQTGEDKFITAQLQGLLRKSYPKRKIEVVNAAFYTYNSAEEMVLITTKLLAYQPDAFVVLDGYNDFIKAYYFPTLPPYWGQHQEFLYRTHERTQSIKGLLAQVGYLLSKRFYCLALPRAMLFAAKHHPAAAAAGAKKIDLDSTPYARALNEYLQMQTTIIGVAKAHKIPLVLAFQPNVNYRKPMSDEEKKVMAEWNVMKARYSDAADIYYPIADKKYTEFAGRNSGPGVQLYNWSGMFSSMKETLYIDSCHYNDRGAELIAKAMAPVVARALGL